MKEIMQDFFLINKRWKILRHCNFKIRWKRTFASSLDEAMVSDSVSATATGAFKAPPPALSAHNKTVLSRALVRKMYSKLHS